MYKLFDKVRGIPEWDDFCGPETGPPDEYKMKPFPDGGPSGL